MKKTILIFITGLMPICMMAQKTDIQTLFEKGETHYSAYLSSTLVFSELTDNLHLHSAFSIGLIVNRNSFLGIYRSNTNSVFYGKVLDNQLKDPLIRQFSHKGIEYEYVVNPLHLVNFGGGFKFGTGKLVLNPDPEFDSHYNIEDRFLIAMPFLAASVNLFEWMKLKFSASYRMVYGIDSSVRPWGSATSIRYVSKDFNRPEFSLSLVIGGLNDKAFMKK